MAARRRWRVLAAMVLIAAVLTYLAVPYVRAASLFVRVARIGGRVEEFASQHARTVTILPPHTVATRNGDVPAQFYRPDGRVSRSVLLIPGIHSMGIREQIIFPEIDYDNIDQVRGLDVTITTNAQTDAEAFALLSALGMPFARDGRPAGFETLEIEPLATA